MGISGTYNTSSRRPRIYLGNSLLLPDGPLRLVSAHQQRGDSLRQTQRDDAVIASLLALLLVSRENLRGLLDVRSKTIGSRSLLLQQRGGLLASDVQQLHQRPVISAQIHTLASRVEVSADRGQRRQRSQTLGQRGSRMRQQRREGLSLLRGSEILLHNQQHIDPRPTIS